MAVINQLSGVSTSNGMDLPFKNYSGADIPAGTALICDSSNAPGTNTPGGVLTTADSTKCIGFALTVLKAGGMGMVRCGGLAVAIAGAAITYGVPVMTNSSGQVVTQTSGLTQIGIAMSAATASTDQVLVLIAPAKNA